MVGASCPNPHAGPHDQSDKHARSNRHGDGDGKSYTDAVGHARRDGNADPRLYADGFADPQPDPDGDGDTGDTRPGSRTGQLPLRSWGGLPL
jgi:hypothetical protein